MCSGAQQAPCSCKRVNFVPLLLLYMDRASRRTSVRVKSLTANELHLSLGQVGDDDRFDEWDVGETATSPVHMKRSSIVDGEHLDPEVVSVSVFSGMKFYDTVDERTVTVDKAVWFAWRQCDDVPMSDPTHVRFEESEHPDDDDSPSLKLTRTELAEYIASGRYQNVTEEADT